MLEYRMASSKFLGRVICDLQLVIRIRPAKKKVNLDKAISGL